MSSKPHSPLVSVVVPSYNHAKFIKEAIQSILSQTYQNFEIIIIDDCSTDRSIEVINTIVDSRIYFEQLSENHGAVDALNYAISKANGKYIALLNSDDAWFPEKLDKQVSFLEDNKDFDIVFSDTVFINEYGEVLGKKEYHKADRFSQSNRTSGEWLRKFFYDFNCLCHPSMMIRKELYETHQYNPSFQQLPDFKMWVELLKRHKIFVSSEQLVKFRNLSGEKNSSANTSINRIRFSNEIYFILNTFFDNVTLSDFHDGFSDLIQYKKGILSEKYFLKCEQAFLYLQVEHEMAHIYKQIGLQKLYELISVDESRSILANYYNFTDKDFFNLTGDYSGLIYGEKPLMNMAKHVGRKSLEFMPRVQRIVIKLRNLILK
ncbi:MAG TPA: glycosyltransferase [Candidatus Paenibacillus intestinavium]|nr:glycosyltransferase [Candidatus Paenibacillus intestinavium]